MFYNSLKQSIKTINEENKQLKFTVSILQGVADSGTQKIVQKEALIRKLRDENAELNEKLKRFQDEYLKFISGVESILDKKENPNAADTQV